MIFILIHILSTICLVNLHASTETQTPSTTLILMPGMHNEGFDFFITDKELKKRQQDQPTNQQLNNHKDKEKCFQYRHNHAISIYYDNIEGSKFDFGGKNTIKLYHRMLCDAHIERPNDQFILAGHGAGCNGVLGGLADLLDQGDKDEIISKIKGIMISKPTISTHFFINNSVTTVPILKYVPLISPIILPLLFEYVTPLLSLISFAMRAPIRFSYDAFAPQLISHFTKLNDNKEFQKIPILFITSSSPIAINSSDNPVYWLKKESLNKPFEYTERTAIMDFILNQNKIHNHDFIKNIKVEQSHCESDRPRKEQNFNKVVNLAQWFTSKTPLQRFGIRRLRDAICLAITAGFFYGIRLSLRCGKWLIIRALHTWKK